jgi:hypothetical protein
MSLPFGQAPLEKEGKLLPPTPCKESQGGKSSGQDKTTAWLFGEEMVDGLLLVLLHLICLFSGGGRFIWTARRSEEPRAWVQANL